MSGPAPFSVSVPNGTSGTQTADNNYDIVGFVPGQTFYFGFYNSATRITGTNAETITSKMRWWDAAGTELTPTTKTVTVNGSTSGFQFNEGAHVAPAGAVRARANFTFTPGGTTFQHDIYVTACRVAKTQAFATVGATLGPGGNVTGAVDANLRPYVDFTQSGHLSKNIDNIGDGSTYGRPILSRLNAGKPWIDFSEGIHAGKNVDNIGDGATYGRPLATRLNAGRPVVDFSEGIHPNKNMDNISDGTTFARPLANRLNVGRPLIDFSETIHSNKSVDNIADGSTYGRPLATRLNAGKPVVDFAEGIHFNKSLASVDSPASTKLGGIATGAGTNIVLTGLGAGPVAIIANSAQKTGGAAAWDTNVISKQSFRNSAYVTGTFTGAPAMIGLTRSTTGTSYTDLDLAWYWSGGTAQIYASGVQLVASVTGAAMTDQYSIEVADQVARFFRNGALVATTTVASDQTWYFGSALNSNGAGFKDVTFGQSHGSLLSAAGSNIRLGDSRNAPAILSSGNRYIYNQTPTYSAPTTNTSNVGSSTITVPAGTLTIGGAAVSYPQMTVNVSGTGSTTYTYYLYGDDPSYSGTTTLVATTSAVTTSAADGRIYFGSCQITYPAAGGTGTGGGGTGGGGGLTCVWEEAWVETMRGYVQAKDVLPGDILRVLTDDRTGTTWEPCTANRAGIEASYVIRGRDSHIAVTVSASTPITLRDGSVIRVTDIDGHELPFCAGEDFWWEPCSIEPAGQRVVQKIECNQKTYAAGDGKGLSILTHNPKP